MSLLPMNWVNDLDMQAVYEWLNDRWVHIAVTSMTLAVSTATMFLLSRIDYPARLFHRVDPTSSMDGGMLVAQVLQAHGVKCVFTLCGGHVSTILVGCEKLGIRVIDTRHEATTVFAADAVARLTGNVGVAVVTAGPGVTNTITAIKNAQMAESPVLILGGGAATLSKGRGALQDIDQMSVCRPVCKAVARVTRVRDIVPTLREAIRIARSDTPGPVFVELPIDVLYEYKLARSLASVGADAKSKRKRPLLERAANRVKLWFLEQLIDALFAGAFVPRPLTPLPLSVPLHRKADVLRTVQMIREARRPLILLGSQSLQPPVSAENIAIAVRSLGIPCFLGGMARGLLGVSDKGEQRLHFRHKRREATLEADLIILAGITVDFRLDYGRILNRQAPIVAVNRDKQSLYLNSDLFWRPTLAIQADVGSFLVDLFRTARDTLNLSTIHANWGDWYATLGKREDERDAEIVKQAALEPTAGSEAGTGEVSTVNSLRLLREVDASLTERSIIVADGGDFVGSAAYTLRPRAPLSWLDPGAFGTLGSGGGFALGAKAVRPDADVIIVYGDGALGFSMMEFDSFERQRLPVMAIVGNDACWSQIAREQVRFLKSNVACQLAYTNYHDAVRGLGSHGERISSMNVGRLREIIEESRRRARDDKQSTLLNCLIAKSSFRDGSISV